MNSQTAMQTTFAIAHHDYEGALNRHAFFRVNDRATSEDLVQDTFMKTWNYLVKGGKIIMMKAFLYHILNNLIVDNYRKRKTSSLDALLEDGYEPSTEEHTSITDMMDGKIASLHIGRLLEKYQKVLRMKYEQHLTLSEMSAMTGQSRNTIAVQMHRGLRQLKSLYENPYACAISS